MLVSLMASRSVAERIRSRVSYASSTDARLVVFLRASSRAFPNSGEILFALGICRGELI